MPRQDSLILNSWISDLSICLPGIKSIGMGTTIHPSTLQSQFMDLNYALPFNTIRLFHNLPVVGKKNYLVLL